MCRCYGAAGDTAAEQALLPLCRETDAEIVVAHLVLMLDQNMDAAQVRTWLQPVDVNACVL